MSARQAAATLLRANRRALDAALAEARRYQQSAARHVVVVAGPGTRWARTPGDRARHVAGGCVVEVRSLGHVAVDLAALGQFAVATHLSADTDPHAAHFRAVVVVADDQVVVCCLACELDLPGDAPRA